MADSNPLDRLTLLTAVSLEMPIAVVSMLSKEHKNQLKILSQFGMKIQDPKSQSTFCKYTLEKNDVLVIPDTKNDSRFSQDPLVHGDQAIEFYAGAPLVSQDGKRVGTLCVMDHRIRTWSQRSTMTLRLLSEFALEIALVTLLGNP